MATDIVRSGNLEPNDVPSTWMQVVNIDGERARRKQQLTATLRVIARNGHADGIAGHVSVRDPILSDCMWINPFGASFYSVREDDLVLIAPDGKVLEGKGECLPETATLHAEIQRCRPEVIAIVHAHTVYATALSVAGRLLRPISVDACVFRNQQILFDEFRWGEDAHSTAIRFVSELGQRSVGVWRAHGLWTVGTTLESALWKLLAYERACRIQIYSSLIGPAEEIPAELAQLPEDIESLARLGGRPLYESIQDSVRRS